MLAMYRSRTVLARSCAHLQRRLLTQQASPLQETSNVREIHKLMAEVRGDHPQRLKVLMPSE